MLRVLLPWSRKMANRRSMSNCPIPGRSRTAPVHEIVVFPAFDRAVEHAFTAGLRRHHALDDAKANRLGGIEASGDTER